MSTALTLGFGTGFLRHGRVVPPGSEFLRPLQETDVHAVLSDALEEPRPGDRIGSYEVVERIGAGGMGCVYRARRIRRAPEDFAQDVAVKVIAPRLVVDAGASDLLRRFERERRILARLEHPGIARLIDGGTTDEGRPFLVMELVCGEPIDRHADRESLGLTARLELFREVCAAVRHAHRHLVIHRDIKPSNVLVSDEGQVKLLDFGASRWLQEDADSFTRTRTAAGAPLTLACASPEQVRGEPAATASDIYALGALLYLLLTGRPPHDIDRCSRYEAMRRICAARPEFPSAAAFAAAVRPSWAASLCGDLDQIVMMALRAEPHRRYETVEQLDDDLRRHLERRTVRARGDGWGYRAATFIRRNRGLTMVAGAAILAGSVAAVALTVGYVQAQRAERLARSEQVAALEAESTARMSLEFLQGMLASANSWRAGPEVTVVELLHEAARGIDDQVHPVPTMEAGVRVAIGRTWAALMRWDEALPQLERAAALLRETQRDPLALAECLSLLGRARTHLQVGDAVATQREGLALREHALGSEHPLVAESRGNLAFALWAHRGFEGLDATCCAEAERGYLHALDLYRRLGLDRTRDAARFTMSLGCMYARQQRLLEAEQCFDDALEIYACLPTSEDLYEITTLRISAEVLERLGRATEALARLRTCRDRLRPELDHPFARQIHWRIAELTAGAHASDGTSDAGWTEYSLAVASDLERLADRWSLAAGVVAAGAPDAPAALADVGAQPGSIAIEPSTELRAAAWRLRADGDHATALAAALDLASSAAPSVLGDSVAPPERWRRLAAFLESQRCVSVAEKVEAFATLVGAQRRS